VITKTASGFKVTTQFKEVDKLHPSGHTGIDISLPEGSPLFSIGNGHIENIVNYHSENIGKGIYVRLDSGEKVIYGHLSDTPNNIHIGDKVEVGDLIAYSGNTGRSTGGHLHLGLRDSQSNEFIDPTKYADMAVSKDNPWMPNFIENPYDKVGNSISELNNKLDTFMYWINPKHWFTEGWSALETFILSADTATWVMCGTMIGVWLMMAGLKQPKKYIFWGWIIFWVLRGFVFA
jgi:murein DD-endopeptidase MepM/ murein hydrolase activator NlpD